MQYHGVVESYTFEYKLSTDTNWITAPVQTTANYTYEGLTGGKSYNLRVTITDRAGNTSTGTNTANTRKPEKNPGGDIINITNDPTIYPGKDSNLDTSRTGASVDYSYPNRSASLTAKYTGVSFNYIDPSGSPWYIWAEDQKYLFLVKQGKDFRLKRILWFK